MANNLRYLVLILILVFSIGCNEDDNSNDLNLPEDFDLTTSECPAEDIRAFPDFNNELAWSCMSLDGGSEFFPGTLSQISGVTSCSSVLSRGDNWCLIEPIGRAMFTATHQTFIEPPFPIPPADEDLCRIDDSTIDEEVICEIVRINNRSIK